MDPFSFDTNAYVETFSQPSNYTFTDSDFTGAYGQLGAFDMLAKSAGTGAGTGGLTGRVGQQQPVQDSVKKPATIMDYLEAFGIPFARSFGSNVGTGLAAKIFGLQAQASPYEPMLTTDKDGKVRIAGQSKDLNERLKDAKKKREELEADSGIFEEGDGMFASQRPQIDIFNAGEKAYQGMRA